MSFGNSSCSPLTHSFCFSPSQAHGSGGPEELHLLAESERRCHSVRRSGLRHVQSTSQTAVIRQHETATSSPPVPSVDSAPSLLPERLKKKSLDEQPTNQLGPLPQSPSSISHNMSKKQMCKLITTFYIHLKTKSLVFVVCLL